MKVKAKMKDADGVWIEVFHVYSKKTAEQEIKKSVEFFNKTIKEGELIREFVELVE